MKAEQVILSFVAVIVGLIAAGVAFYLYQMTKVVPSEQAKPATLGSQVAAKPTPTSTSVMLTIDSPKDEEVFDKKVITISGKTLKDATVIVSSEDGDQVVKPAASGSFSITQTIPDGTTQLTITAVAPSGEEETLTKTVTFSTENF